jgi:hypothetical protein
MMGAIALPHRTPKWAKMAAILAESGTGTLPQEFRGKPQRAACPRLTGGRRRGELPEQLLDIGDVEGLLQLGPGVLR